MDIFGKTSPSTKKKSPFQSELTAKMRERKSQGLAADLTETEEDDDEALASDDDILAAYSLTSKAQPRSQSPWRAEAEGRTTPRAEPPKPQSRNNIGATDSKQKQKIPIKPKNELDRLLADNDEDENKLLQTQKKPWQPPQFKDFSNKPEPKPQPRGSCQAEPSFLKSAKQRGSLLEDDENSDDELTGAYTRQLQQQRQSPRSGKQTPVESRNNQFSNKERQSPSAEGRKDSFGRASPKSKEDDIFGSRASGKPKSSGSNLDDIFGKRKSPTDQDLFGGRKTPKEAEQDRKTPTNGRKSPKSEDLFGRKTPTQREDPFGRKSPALKEDKFGRKPQTSSGPSMDDIFGGKKRAESPLFKSKQRGTEDSPREKSQAGGKKGLYMASLLADSDEERDDGQSKPKTRTSYMDNLLGEDHGQQKATSQTRTAYMDSLLGDKSEGERKPRPRLRAPPTEKQQGEERDSSLARDVDKDPMMIQQQKKEREAKLESRKGKQHTDSQRAEFDIDEVADAQNSLSMTFIQSEKPVQKVQSTPVKPKASKPSGTSTTQRYPTPTPDSTMSFESASDIRNYIYQEWHQKKMATAKQSLSQKKQLEKEAQLKKEKEIMDKKVENDVTFKTWKERKDDTLRARIRQKKAEEKKVEDKKKEELDKKKDAEMIFKKWKEDKDETIVDKRRKQKRDEIDKVTEKRDEEDRKKKDAEGAFAGWKKKKDKGIRQNVRQVKLIEKQESTQKLRDTRHREIEAEQLYEKWVQRKEEQKRREKLQARSQRSLQESPRPAWSPANKTIPHGR